MVGTLAGPSGTAPTFRAVRTDAELDGMASALPPFRPAMPAVKTFRPPSAKTDIEHFETRLKQMQSPRTTALLTGLPMPAITRRPTSIAAVDVSATSKIMSAHHLAKKKLYPSSIVAEKVIMLGDPCPPLRTAYLMSVYDGNQDGKLTQDELDVLLRDLQGSTRVLNELRYAWSVVGTTTLGAKPAAPASTGSGASGASSAAAASTRTPIPTSASAVNLAPSAAGRASMNEPVDDDEDEAVKGAVKSGRLTAPPPPPTAPASMPSDGRAKYDAPRHAAPAPRDEPGNQPGRQATALAAPSAANTIAALTPRSHVEEERQSVTSTTHLQPRRRGEVPQPPPRRAPQGPSRVSPVPTQGGYTMHACTTTKQALHATTSLPADEQVMATDGL